MSFKYEPLTTYRLGHRIMQVIRLDLIRLWLATDPENPPPPVPPPDDPVPPPAPDPVPPPPEPDPVPPPPPDPVPPPPPEPPPLPPELDNVIFPGVVVLSYSQEGVVKSHMGQGWWRVDHETLASWEIESKEHLLKTLLEYITHYRACVAFDIPPGHKLRPIVYDFVIWQQGAVYEP